MAQAQPVQRLRARHVAEADDIAVAPCLRHDVDVAFHADIRLVVRAQQVRDHAPDPAEAEDDGAHHLGGLFFHFPITRTQLYTPGDVMADTGQNGRDGEANGRRHLPEGRRIPADEISCHGGAQHDQRGLRGAGHQHAGFQRDATPRTGDS